MSTFWALFDMSAHARGWHGYSGPHTTGWQILSFFAGFYLLAGMYAIFKHTLADGEAPQSCQQTRPRARRVVSENLVVPSLVAAQLEIP
jgi:hypothetical protein